MDGNLMNKLGHNLEDYQMKEPRGVAINSKGEIIVTDSCRRCVYIFQLEGAFCDIIWGEVAIHRHRNLSFHKAQPNRHRSLL